MGICAGYYAINGNIITPPSPSCKTIISDADSKLLPRLRVYQTVGSSAAARSKNGRRIMANVLLPSAKLLTSDPIAIVGHIISAIILWVSSTVIYRRWFHPLAKIPGPFWASVTHFYIVKYNLFSKRSQFYKQVEKLHQQYGK